MLLERAFGELAGGSSIRRGSNKFAADNDGGFPPLLVISEWLPDLFGVLLALSFVPTRNGVLADFGSSLRRANQFERKVTEKIELHNNDGFIATKVDWCASGA